MISCRIMFQIESIGTLLGVRERTHEIKSQGGGESLFEAGVLKMKTSRRSSARRRRRAIRNRFQPGLFPEEPPALSTFT